MPIRRGELSDAHWTKLAPLLPPEHTGQPGHPWQPHRRILNGILWILRTGGAVARLAAAVWPASNRL